MSKKLRAAHIKQPSQRTASGTSAVPKGTLLRCSDCQAVHEKKAWRAPNELSHAKKDPWVARTKEVRWKYVLCPACKDAKEGTYSGMVVIRRIPGKILNGLLSFIRKFGARSRSRHIERRLLSVQKNGKNGANEVVVTTTENQMAGRLAEKIRDTYKHQTRVTISFSREPHKREHATVLFDEPQEDTRTA